MWRRLLVADDLLAVNSGKHDIFGLLSGVLGAGERGGELGGDEAGEAGSGRLHVSKLWRR